MPYRGAKANILISESESLNQLFMTPWTIESMEFSRPEYWSGYSLLQGIFPTQGSNPGLTQGIQILYPAEPQGKSKNTGGGSLSLLQGIFLTQELNWGLLHCGRILYQLNYQGHLVYRIRKSEIFF